MEVKENWMELNGDGAVMSVYVAEPAAGGPHPGLLHFHTMLGVNEQHKAMARRLASEGYVVALPDLYYRLGHRISFESTPDRTAREAAMASLTDWGLTADTRAVLDLTKRLPNVDPQRIGVTGYCLGGRVAFLAGCLHRDIKVVIDCYGPDIVSSSNSPARPVRLIELADGLQGPVLQLSGSRDVNPTPTDVTAMAAAMAKLGKQFESEVYEGAGHAFFDEDIPQKENGLGYYEPACTQGWERKLAFLKMHLQDRLSVGKRIT